MKTSKLTLLALALVVGVLSSCKKKKEEAPAAPSSSVKSFTFSTNTSAWALNNKAYNANFTLVEIDQDIMSSGSVTVFRGDGTGSTWTAMPVTVENIQCSYSISLNNVKVTMSASDNTTQCNNPGAQQFRVVVIKGSARKANPNVNFNDYNEVKRRFRLAD